MSSTSCPVFRPTSLEFADFRAYIAQIEKSVDLDNTGICKIIPPQEWLIAKGDFEMNNMPIVIENPIKQVVSGRAGIFNVDLLELKPMKIKDFADYDQRNSNNSGNTDQEKERKFWRSLGCPGAWDHPIYGADQIGTLFEKKGGGSWNVNNLDSIVNLLGPVPGVSSAYLYVGTWRSMFAYHVEDLDLYSINYLHGGASKSWYSIKPKDKKRFESFAVSYFVEEHQQCHEFLRHKTKMFSPTKLKECGIEYTTALHNPGEFIITFPGAYHAGFNHGLNVAESTNFATTRWFDIGKRAKRCICRPHSVSINVSRLETMFLRTEKLRGSDLSVFHRNSEDDESEEDDTVPGCCAEFRRYRCICAADGIQEVDENTPLSICCSACSLWGHINCYDHVNVATPICFMCVAIELDSANLDCNSPNHERSETADCSNSPVKKKSPKSPKVKKSPSFDTDDESNKRMKRAKRKVHVDGGHELAIGDLVNFQSPSTCMIAEGLITDIEDNLGRLHVKGTRKDLDIWILLTECILIEKNCRRRSKASRSATPQAKPVSSPPEVMTPTQVMRLTSTSSKPVEEMQTNVKIELFVPSTGVDVKEVKSPLVYDSTETIPITNYNVKHIIPFIVRSPDSVDLDDSKSINSVSTAGAFLKPCVIGNSTGITNILSENLIRNLPMISQISQTDPTVKNSGRAELHILAHANVSETTCALGSEVQNDSDWKNPIAKNIASLRSDPFSESNFKLPLPDHFFTFHGYRICLALTALDEKELQDFKLWLASAVVPLCTVSSLSTEMCITLSESVRTTSMKETIIFLKSIISYGHRGQVSVVRSMALRYLTLVVECHPDLANYISNELTVSMEQEEYHRRN